MGIGTTVRMEACTLSDAEYARADERPPPTILFRDSDSKFEPHFEAALARHGVQFKRLPYRSPHLNAFVERWIRSVRYECLEYFVILGRRHLDRLVGQFVRYYHKERPHQRIGNRC